MNSSRIASGSRGPGRAFGPAPELKMGMVTRDNRRLSALASCEGLVKNMARRYGNGNRSREKDLEQEGRIGLIYAADRFDPARGVKFVSYAGQLARGEMQHFLRDYAFAIGLPAWIQELLHKINKAVRVIEQETSHQATPAEIAERITASEADVIRALKVQSQSDIASLDPMMDDEIETPLLDLEHLIVEGEPGSRLPLEDRLFARQAVARLAPREREVVMLYFYRDLRQSQIARHLGISQAYVSYLLKRGLSGLRVAGEACMEEMR